MNSIDWSQVGSIVFIIILLIGLTVFNMTYGNKKK